MGVMGTPAPSEQVPVLDKGKRRRCIVSPTHMVEDENCFLAWAVHQHLDQVVEIARFGFEVLVLPLYGNHGRGIWIR